MKEVTDIFKHKIELVTVGDIYEFVSVATKASGKVLLTDETGFCVSGKSLLGATAAIEWDSLYCLSENDIYTSIQKFCVG